MDPYLHILNNVIKDYSVTVENGSFIWTVGSIKKPLLRAINIRISNGELVAVVGPTGSGKSSFLAALIGQMILLEGRVNVAVNLIVLSSILKTINSLNLFGSLKIVQKLHITLPCTSILVRSLLHYSRTGADRESDGWGAPLAVTGLSNLGKAWLFLDF